MEVKDLEAQINFRYKNFPNGQQKEKAQIHTFFKEKKNLINKKWIKNEFSTFLRTKKPKEASFGVNPVHDLYRNNEKYTQPGRFAVTSPFH